MAGKATRRAFSYLRFSTQEQSAGDSTRRQTEPTQNFCDRMGWVLDTTLALSDKGVSGWKGANSATGALAEFLRLVERGTVPKGSILVIEHLDRLTRQTVRKALGLWLQLLDAGISIATIDPERVYAPETSNDPLGLLEPVLMFAANNEKSERLSSRLKQAWAEKRRQGGPLTGWCPAWLRLNDDGTAYELIPENAKIVRKIVGWALDGYGDMRLVQKLNAEGVPVISGNATWTSSYVSKILRSPALIGEYRPGTQDWVKEGDIEKKRRQLTGEVREGYFPAAITAEQWYRLRAARGSRTRAGGKVGEQVANLFSGLLFNARDGLPMQRVVKDHPRLISTAVRNGLDGDTQTIGYDAVEKVLLATLVGDVGLADLFGGGPAVTEDRLAVLSGRLAAVDARIAATQAAAKTANAAAIAGVVKLLADFDAERATILAELESERTFYATRGHEAETLGDIQGLARLLSAEGDYDRADVRMRLKTRLRQVIESVRLAVVGKKKSKWKLCVAQAYFKGGGSRAILFATCRTSLSWAVADPSPVPAGHDLRDLDGPGGALARKRLADLEAAVAKSKGEFTRAMLTESGVAPEPAAGPALVGIVRIGDAVEWAAKVTAAAKAKTKVMPARVVAPVKVAKPKKNAATKVRVSTRPAKAR